MENQQINGELTPEQLEARRDEMKQFYENSLPYLEARAIFQAGEECFWIKARFFLLR